MRRSARGPTRSRPQLRGPRLAPTSAPTSALHWTQWLCPQLTSPAPPRPRRRTPPRFNVPQDEIVREAQTMRQLNHPNLLPLYCSFVHKQHLWMVMPYVQGGSVLNIMRFAYPEVGGSDFFGSLLMECCSFEGAASSFPFILSCGLDGGHSGEHFSPSLSCGAGAGARGGGVGATGDVVSRA